MCTKSKEICTKKLNTEKTPFIFGVYIFCRNAKREQPRLSVYAAIVGIKDDQEKRGL